MIAAFAALSGSIVNYKTPYLKQKQYGVPAAQFRKSRTSHP